MNPRNAFTQSEQLRGGVTEKKDKGFDTVTGTETYTLTDIGNLGTGNYARTIEGHGEYDRVSAGPGATLPSTTDVYDYVWTQTGDPHSGTFDLTETGATRYDQIELFKDVSNTQAGQTPGHMNVYPFGQTFVDPVYGTMINWGWSFGMGAEFQFWYLRDDNGNACIIAIPNGTAGLGGNISITAFRDNRAPITDYLRRSTDGGLEWGVRLSLGYASGSGSINGTRPTGGRQGSLGVGGGGYLMINTGQEPIVVWSNF